MTRLVKIVLCLALAAPAPAWADGVILDTGRRLIVRQEAARQAAPAAPPAETPPPAEASGAQDPPPTLTSSGMGRGKKMAIGAALAVAFAAIVYAIDHGVEDNTPSSRGLR